MTAAAIGLMVSSHAQTFVQPAPATVDSSTASVAPVEAVQLSAKGSFQSDHVAVGDTLIYRLLVEWKDERLPVVVLAPENMETPGFKIADQSTAHRKTVENGEVRNTTEFTYKLVPKVPGAAKVSALKLRYLTGFSNREEALYVPASFIDVEPAHVPLWKRWWFQLIAGIVILAGLIWGGRRALQTAKTNQQKSQATKNRDFSPDVKALRGRWNTADSRVWLEDAEKVCLEYLRHQLGKSAPENPKFELLLEAYLARHSGETGEWSKLREAFHHARYAGGRKEPYELQDTYRTLKTCLHIQGDNE
ncbi:MAG TPA: hypothetical protein DCQ83_04985 [Fibrobacteres bacterium]|nr:hypothetical protein [Fibrobacterota bacterium]